MKERDEHVFDLILKAVLERQKDYLRLLIIGYMRRMTERGVKPSFENMIHHDQGSLWGFLSLGLSKEDLFYFRSMWMTLFRETWKEKH